MLIGYMRVSKQMVPRQQISSVTHSSLPVLLRTIFMKIGLQENLTLALDWNLL